MNDLEVLICGIPHKIRFCEDIFDADALHMGQINFGDACIYINKELSPVIKREQLCHEIIHGILVHLGYQEESQDEKFVQQLGNAINQSFSIKWIGEQDNERL